MKEQQKRKFKQIHPEIEDGIDLRRCPELLNNSCVLYCAAVSEKYEDQSQRNPYVTLSRLAPHFEDEIAGLQKRTFLAGFGLFWTHFVCM